MFTSRLPYKDRVMKLIILAFTGLLFIVAVAIQPPNALTVPRTAATPRLVVDLRKQQISVMLADVVLRQYAFTSQDDTGDIEKFADTWSGHTAEPAVIENVYLLSAADALSAAELEIIAEETNLDAAAIQRYLPREMILFTSSGQSIRVETSCPGAKTFVWVRAKEGLRRAWHKLTGRKSLEILLSTDDAMSLYGIARNRPEIYVR